MLSVDGFGGGERTSSNELVVGAKLGRQRALDSTETSDQPNHGFAAGLQTQSLLGGDETAGPAFVVGHRNGNAARHRFRAAAQGQFQRSPQPHFVTPADPHPHANEIGIG